MKLKLISGVTERVIMEISETNDYVSKIRRLTGHTHAHVQKIIGRLEEEKIITKKKEGQKIVITLTEKGKQIQSHLKEIRRLL